MTHDTAACLDCHPVTVERWDDLCTVFGVRGASHGCWCMRWRVPRAQFESARGESNKSALRAGIRDRRVFGVIAYLNAEPVGWCSVGPRRDLCGLEVSELLASVDGRPVWSVACLYLTKRYRRQGLSAELLRGAVAYAVQCGAKIVEGYPISPRSHGQRLPVAVTWTGLESIYTAAGFVEVARRVDVRPIMRYRVPPPGPAGEQ